MLETIVAVPVAPELIQGLQPLLHVGLRCGADSADTKSPLAGNNVEQIGTFMIQKASSLQVTASQKIIAALRTVTP